MTPTFNADDFLGQVQDRLIKMGCSPPLWPNVDDPVQSAADMIADLLRGLSERAEWRPIETAPRNYNPVLLKQDDAIGEGCYANHIRCWEFFNPGLVLRRNPTHWMPLPKPPKDKP
jgi:hypothetical protein